MTGNKCPYMPLSAPSQPNRPERNTVIDPYNRSEVIKLLRRAADHASAGQRSIELSANLHQLADHLEQED